MSKLTLHVVQMQMASICGASLSCYLLKERNESCLAEKADFRYSPLAAPFGRLTSHRCLPLLVASHFLGMRLGGDTTRYSIPLIIAHLRLLSSRFVGYV